MQLGAYVERGDQRRRRSRNVLPIRGIDADDTDTNIERDRDRAAALVGAERDGLEQVDAAVPGQRPGGLPGLGHVLVTDPQHQPAGVLGVVGFGPHAAERAAQPGGQLVPAVDHLGDGHAVGQVAGRRASRGRPG